MLRDIRFSLARLLTLALCGLVAPAWAMDAKSESALQSLGDHERQLNAIRSAIIRSAQEAPTQVYATAWIDASGSLNESAYFNTDTRVRGVRVESYLEQPGRRDEQRVAADIVLPAYLRKGMDPAVCVDQAARWRMPISLHFKVVAGAAPQDEGLSAWLGSQVEEAATQLAASSARWFVSRPFTAPARQGAEAYWRAFLGAPVDQSDWQLHVLLNRIDPPVATSMRAAFRDPALFWQKVTGESPPQPWRLSLTLVNARTGEVRFDQQRVLPAEQALDHHAGAVDLQSIRASIGAWLQELEMQVACEPIHFALTPVTSGNPRSSVPVWTIRISDQSGLKAGDRLLVIDRQQVPARIFEPEAIRRVVLAEVARVGVRQVELRQLAGPPLDTKGDWVALPL